MSLNEQIAFTVLGAVITFLAGLLSILFNNWISNWNKQREKLERAYYLMGKAAALNNPKGDVAESVQASRGILKNSLARMNKQEVDALLGMVEAFVMLGEEKLKSTKTLG